jgi:hypothetical protein
MILLALALPGVAAALPPTGEALAWRTLNTDNSARTLEPAPEGQEWRQACSCRQPYEGADGELYRQCLCTAPSLAPPDLQAPLSWIVQRAAPLAAQRTLAGTP